MSAVALRHNEAHTGLADTVNIRKATPADGPLLVALVCAFRDFLQRPAPSDGDIADSLVYQLRSPDVDIAIAEEQGAALGYATLLYRYSLWANGLEATLQDLFVREALRGAGAGHRLARAALALAAERGCRSIRLDTNEHNRAAHAIYTALGFSAVSAVWNGRQIAYRRSLP